MQNKLYLFYIKQVRLGAELGRADAQHNLGGMYANGQGVTQDDNEAVKWFRLAADQGHASAQHNLGVMYENGQGVTQDDNEAVKWYRLAAEQGYAGAQNNLGIAYENGEGVIQDNNEAVKWYRLAAEQRHANAQYNLGVMYANGQGVTQDDNEAVKWYRLAAEQGHTAAQNNIGAAYFNGQGVVQDDNEAVKWYRLAAEQGNTPTVKLLKKPNVMNDEKNENAVEIGKKPAEQKSGVDVLFKLLDELYNWLSNTPIASIILGAAMIMWYDLIDAGWLASGKGAIFWFLWSRPVGVFLVFLSLYTIWERKFSKSKIEETE